MSILFLLFFLNPCSCCIPVSLPDDSDGFTTTTTTTIITTTESTTMATTTAQSTSTTTTAPTCLTTCQDTADFTDCNNVVLPGGYTCDAVAPPTSVRSGTSCSFDLDCSIFGPDSYPNFKMGAMVIPATTQIVSYSCPDGATKWTDSFSSMMDDYSVCATQPNCLTSCPSVSSFTSCLAVGSALPYGVVCNTVVPTPTATRVGNTCSFTLDCSTVGSMSYPYVVEGGTGTKPGTGQTLSFTCMDGQTLWTDGITLMMQDNSVCGT